MLTAFGLHSIQLELWNILLLVEQQPEETRPCWFPPRVCFLTHMHPQTHERAEGSARQCGLDSVESLQDEEKRIRGSSPGFCSIPRSLAHPPRCFSHTTTTLQQKPRRFRQRATVAFCNLFSVFAEPRASAQSRGTFTEGKEKHRGKSKISEVATYGSRYKRRVSSHNLCKKKMHQDLFLWKKEE